MSAVAVSVSFDIERDRELFERLLAQSRKPGSGFTVSSSSERFSSTDEWSERARKRICKADQVIVICGAHTNEAEGVIGELRITQEEDTPYFLLWGRRDTMCTKPVGAKPTEGMYSWTPDIISEQISLIGRQARGEATARALRRPPKPEKTEKTESGPSAP
jgi:hypothetical protein